MKVEWPSDRMKGKTTKSPGGKSIDICGCRDTSSLVMHFCLYVIHAVQHRRITSKLISPRFDIKSVRICPIAITIYISVEFGKTMTERTPSHKYLMWLTGHLWEKVHYQWCWTNSDCQNHGCYCFQPNAPVCSMLWIILLSICLKF